MGCGHEDCGCGQSQAVEDQMAQFAEMAALAPEHEHLAPFIGTWDAEVKIWMGPGEPQRSTGEMSNTWTLGGRFVEQKYVGHTYDFEGRGFFGYNKAAGKFEGLWIDSCTTMMQTDTGDYDAGTRTFTMVSRTCCGEMGEMTKRSVIKVHSPDKHTMEMYFAPQDGPEGKCMEITYTRKKK